MSIIISSDGKKAVRIDKSDFEKENRLQEYIYENPESIPLYEIKEDIHLLILAREFPTNSGPIDALGIDKDGELYIVETKLFKNPDKRTVIAQALDYGAALWKHSTNFEDFLNILDEHTQKVFHLRTVEKIKEFFNVSGEEANTILERAKENLNNGSFHFVILMDVLGDRLKDLILYVNQNSQFDVYAVELEYYKHESQEIIIPRIFGAEVKKEVSRTGQNSPRYEWNEDKLLAEAKSKFSGEEATAFQEIYDFSKNTADEVRLGTGTYGSFSAIFNKVCPRSMYTLGTNGRLSFNFDWIEDKELCRKYAELLQKAGFTIDQNIIQGIYQETERVSRGVGVEVKGIY